jgi:hypothetical protein
MAQGRPAGSDPRLTRFAAGLLPILSEGDVAAFRAYLGRWEELLGDLSELADASDADLRRTMRDLRLRPGQFGLPAWPRGPLTPMERPAPPAGPPVVAEPAPPLAPAPRPRAEPAQAAGQEPPTPPAADPAPPLPAAPGSAPAAPGPAPTPPRPERRARRPAPEQTAEQLGLFDVAGE